MVVPLLALNAMSSAVGASGGGVGEKIELILALSRLAVVVVIHLENRQRTKRAAAAARLVTHHSSHTHSCISD